MVRKQNFTCTRETNLTFARGLWALLISLVFTLSAAPTLSQAAAENESAPLATSQKSTPKKEPVKPSLAPSKDSKVSAPTVAGSATENADSLKVVDLSAVRASGETQRLLRNLAQEAGWFPDVQLTVREGIVLITGKVKKAEQIEWLAKTADRLPGVIAVINQTQIEQPAVSDLTPVWEELRTILNSAKRALPLILIGLCMLAVFLFAGIYLSRFFKSLWGGHISNPFLLSTVSRLTMIPVWAVFFYLALRTAGLSGLATTIIGGTGAASLVIGFAFKGIAENYLSGLLLAMRSPFTKGDEIQVDKYSGFVQSLNMRGTTIIDYDGSVVLIPNSIVIQSVVRNRTANKSVRLSFTIGISYTDSIEHAFELISKVLKAKSQLLTKPGPSVSVDKLSSSGIDLVIFFWFDAGVSNGDALKAELVGEIKDRLLANGFHIPDPAREVCFPDILSIKSADQKSEDANPTDHAERAEKRLVKNKSKDGSTPSVSAEPARSAASDVASTGDGVKVMHKAADANLFDSKS